MSRAARACVPLGGVAAALLTAIPGAAHADPAGPAARPVRWTVDERLYHGDALLAPRFACNTHFSGAAPKDSVGGSCSLLKFGCDLKIKAACARIAPYKPDFHNIERAARETSLFDMSTYTALHRPASPSPLLRKAPGRAEPIRPGARLEPKVLGGAPVQ